MGNARAQAGEHVRGQIRRGDGAELFQRRIQPACPATHIENAEIGAPDVLQPG
jgi:hypothetical protein